MHFPDCMHRQANLRLSMSLVRQCMHRKPPRLCQARRILAHGKIDILPARCAKELRQNAKQAQNQIKAKDETLPLSSLLPHGVNFIFFLRHGNGLCPLKFPVCSSITSLAHSATQFRIVSTALAQSLETSNVLNATIGFVSGKMLHCKSYVNTICKSEKTGLTYILSQGLSLCPSS